MKKYVYVLSAMFLLHSCSSEPKVDGSDFVIDYHENTTFDWNAVLDIEEVIPLETSDSILLSYASECLVAADRIVYADSKQKALYVFNREGKFVYKIDALGAGDKEYTMIKDVAVSQDNRDLYILDQASILVFDLVSGEYRNRITLDEKYASSFYQLAETDNQVFYIWSTDATTSLYVLDKGNVYPIKERDGFPFVCQKFYIDADGKVNLISDCGRYSIETVELDKTIPKYSLDFGRWAFPYDKNMRTVTDWEKVDSQAYFKSLLSAFETKNALYVSTATPAKKLYCIAIQTATSKMIYGNQDADSPVVVIGSDSTSFWGLLYPALFKEGTAISDFIKKHHVSDDDNPIAVRFKFKFT